MIISRTLVGKDKAGYETTMSIPPKLLLEVVRGKEGISLLQCMLNSSHTKRMFCLCFGGRIAFGFVILLVFLYSKQPCWQAVFCYQKETGLTTVS